MNNNKNTIKVTVDKSHLFTLGEKMYRESIEFVRELVNNAYDADATEVRVSIEDDKIIVDDNGGGMNEKGLEQFFTVGSTEKLEKSVSPRYRRKRIGQFGIGKFSALALADRFIVESVKGSFKYSVIFDRHEWKQSDYWDLPIRKERVTSLDKEGTRMILNKLHKKVKISEAEKYLKQSVPLRAKKFNVYLNNNKISAKTVAGRVIFIKQNTLYGLIEGEIVIALNPKDVDEPGIECRVKQVFIKKDLFGLERKYHQGILRITGYVNADWLPLISARSDFIHDSEEYKIFLQLMRFELEKILKEFKKQSDTKNLKKVTAELAQVMHQIKDALSLNPEFVPQGRAVARLKKEAKKKMALASTGSVNDYSEKEDNQEKGDKKSNGDSGKEKDLKKSEEKIEAKPLVVKKIRLKKFGISCGIVSLGKDGPEVLSQGNMVYINQEHVVYQKLYKKRELLSLHLLRLITQELVIMKKPRITAREAFNWQSKLLKDSV